MIPYHEFAHYLLASGWTPAFDTTVAHDLGDILGDDHAWHDYVARALEQCTEETRSSYDPFGMTRHFEIRADLLINGQRLGLLIGHQFHLLDAREPSWR